MAIFARVALVVLVAVVTGYAFYYALQWVAAEADRRGSGAVLRATEGVAAQTAHALRLPTGGVIIRTVRKLSPMQEEGARSNRAPSS